MKSRDRDNTCRERSPWLAELSGLERPNPQAPPTGPTRFAGACLIVDSDVASAGRGMHNPIEVWATGRITPMPNAVALPAKRRTLAIDGRRSHRV